jgi:hypothetical protein
MSGIGRERCEARWRRRLSRAPSCSTCSLTSEPTGIQERTQTSDCDTGTVEPGSQSRSKASLPVSCLKVSASKPDQAELPGTNNVPDPTRTSGATSMITGVSLHALIISAFGLIVSPTWPSSALSFSRLPNP